MNVICHTKKRSTANEDARRAAIRDAARRMREGDAFVYAVTWGNGRKVKIGCTVDIDKRLKTLVVDNHCPTKPTLIRCVRGSIHTEKHIHRVLRRAFGTSARGTHSEVYPAEALSHPVVRSTLGEAA